MPPVSAPPPIIQAADRNVEHCLRLTGEKRFGEAITACLVARKSQPENREVTKALGHALSAR
jgi:hypothetical protein